MQETDTIVRYTSLETTERFNRITNVSSDGITLTLAAVQNVTGICNGALPTGASVTPTFSFGVPNINLNENKALYARIGNDNVSDINLSTANLVVGTNITGESTDGVEFLLSI